MCGGELLGNLCPRVLLNTPGRGSDGKLDSHLMTICPALTCVSGVKFMTHPGEI